MLNWKAVSSDGLYVLVGKGASQTVVGSDTGSIYIDGAIGTATITLGIAGLSGDPATDFVPIPNGTITESKYLQHGHGVQIAVNITNWSVPFNIGYAGK